MKKSIFLSLVFVLLLPKLSFGNFLSEPTGLDLYKKIDSGLYELELKYLEKELKWWDVSWNIADDLNKRARQNWLNDTCFKWNITPKDMSDVYNDVEWTKILSEILKECFWEDWSIWTDTFNKYLWIVNESYAQNSKKAQDKVESIYKIWRIWMYSDWIEENSPFDLVLDLKDINSIIFEEQIPYDGVNNYDLWRTVDWILSWLSPNAAFNLSKYETKIETPILKNQNNNSNLNSEEVCLVDQSWLNSNWLNDLLKSAQNTSQNWLLWNSWSNLENSKNKQSSYKKVNDNSFWPCNNFFCIMIDFVTYNHNLLGWWANLSIEWLLKRSNTHFKKFASTSLIQSKMTTNHFEIWLKDLNLPDIFHVWVQVSYKPVPLYNVDKNEKDADNDEFKYKNLLTRYYRNLWFDYERSNDMRIFMQKEAEIKSVLDSQEYATTSSTKKFEIYNEYLSNLKRQNDFVSRNVVDKKVLHEDMQWFYNKYMELESFSRALMEYTFWSKWIIQKMNEIPQGW